MSAAEIATALGNTRREGRGWRCRCPVHGGQSLVVSDGREGRLLVTCWGGDCKPAAIFAELRRLGLSRGQGECQPEPRPSRPVARVDDDARKTAWAGQLWERAQDARGSPVVRYLAGRAM